MGEYWFRSSPDKGVIGNQYVKMAANEFRSAMHLNLSVGRAKLLLHCINLNLNPLGPARNYYLTPDFPRYEQAFVDYAPLVQNMVGSAKDLMLHTDNVRQNRDRVTAQVTHMEAQTTITDSEMAEALLEKSRAEGVLAAIDGRIKGIQEEIAAKRAELTTARLEMGGAFIATVFEVIGAVVAVVGAVYTGGASLAALPGLLVAAQDTWGSLRQDGQGNLVYQDAYLVDWVDWYDKDGKFNPKMNPEMAALAGGLEKVVDNWVPVVKGTLDLIDKAKVLGDIGSATVDGELENELKELLRRAAELAFERAQGKIVLDQAELHIKTVEFEAGASANGSQRGQSNAGDVDEQHGPAGQIDTGDRAAGAGVYELSDPFSILGHTRAGDLCAS